MTVSAHFYNKFFNHLGAAGINLTSDTIKLAHVTASYTPSQTGDEFWSTPQADEITGTGYTAGGATVGSIAITSAGWDFSGATVSWTGATFSGVRYSILYDSTPVGITSPTASQMPLIGYIDWGAAQSVTSATFSVSWNASGIGQITVA